MPIINLQCHPELLLLCGEYIPYFDTLEEVCLLLSTRPSPEQQVSEPETSSNDIKNENFSWQGFLPLCNIRNMFRKYPKDWTVGVENINCEGVIAFVMPATCFLLHPSTTFFFPDCMFLLWLIDDNI
jgi:hypothetical protein